MKSVIVITQLIRPIPGAVIGKTYLRIQHITDFHNLLNQYSETAQLMSIISM